MEETSDWLVSDASTSLRVGSQQMLLCTFVIRILILTHGDQKIMTSYECNSRQRVASRLPIAGTKVQCALLFLFCFLHRNATRRRNACEVHELLMIESNCKRSWNSGSETPLPPCGTHISASTEAGFIPCCPL